MPRTAKNDIGKAMATTNPRLVVVNSSTSEGRYQQMLRLRPTLLAKVRELTVGPMYIIIEAALEQLVKDLEALPPGTMRTINAFEMDPSKEDREMMDKSAVPVRRVKRGTRKDAPSEVASNDQPAGKNPKGS